MQCRLGFKGTDSGIRSIGISDRTVLAKLVRVENLLPRIVNGVDLGQRGRWRMDISNAKSGSVTFSPGMQTGPEYKLRPPFGQTRQNLAVYRVSQLPQSKSVADVVSEQPMSNGAVVVLRCRLVLRFMIRLPGLLCRTDSAEFSFSSSD